MVPFEMGQWLPPVSIVNLTQHCQTDGYAIANAVRVLTVADRLPDLAVNSL